MKESILRDKLKEFQLFIMENRYSRGLVHDSKNDEDRKKGEAILKDFFIGMVEGKPITKAIEILEYIKEHKWEQTKFKNGDNEERFGVWQYGENFFKWSDLVIDYIVDSLEDMAEKLGGSSLVTKEQSKQPQQLEQPQKKRGRSAKSFSDCILVEDKDGLLAKLHQVLDGRKGRDVYLVLNTLLYEGVLLKYTYTQAKNEFGDIGSDSLKTKYSGSKDDKVSCVSAFDKGEIEGVKKIFSEFLK